MIVAGLCAAVFGLLTIFAFWTNLTRKEAGDWHFAFVESTPLGFMFFIVFVIFDVAVTILFALSIRWIHLCAQARHCIT
jgi:glucan phosphoethanolaminetransferase (alkaline phosphatase superfamily)